MKASLPASKRICQLLTFAPSALLTIVAAIAIGQFIGIASTWAALLALLAIAALLRFGTLNSAIATSLALTIAATIGYLSQHPSHDRDWIPEIARLPRFQFEADTVQVENLRDFHWRSTKDFDERWINASYNLNQLYGLDVIVVPFGDSNLAAHVMLSFGFKDGRQLAVSVETRPERGESYSLIGGATRQLELIYLFGSEADLLGLRILHRGNRVYSFPLKTNPDFARSLLIDLCESANQLHDQPKFYATLRHNCTTTLLRHVDRIRDQKIGLRKEILFPAKLGELLHRLDYLDTHLDWPQAEAAFRVDQTIRQASSLQNFSATLRSGRPSY